MNTNSLTTANTGAVRRLGEAFARWIQRRTDAIDATPPTTRHRMGAWETSASFSAQAALQAKRAREQPE